MSSDKKEQTESNKKMQLYFCKDKNKQFSIEIHLEQETTCKNIYDDNKTKIIEMLKLLNKNLPENFDLDEELEEEKYYFCLIHPKNNAEKKEKEIINNNYDLKLKLTDKIYNKITFDSNMILCFLNKNNSKINLRKKARSLFVLEKDIYENTQDSKLQNNTINENLNEEILFKNIIFLYDSKNKNFIKKDIIIDYEKIFLIKENKYIFANNIEKFNYFLHDSEEFKKYKLKADKMFGYILITINDKEKETYLFGEKKENLFKKSVNAIKCSINNYKISMIDMKVDNDIYSAKSGLFAIYHLIIDNCFLIKEILSNDEKRKIFIEVFPEKKIGEIIEQIIEYKSLFKKGHYLESWTNFKQILAYIEPYNDKKNKELFNILKKINISKYKEVLEKSNEALQNIMIEAKKIAQNQSDNKPNNLQNNLNNALKELLKDNLFDDLFFYLYNLYILPFFEKINKNLKEGESPTNKSLIRKKFQLLLALYYFKFFELKFNYLGDKDDIRHASMLYYK